MVIWTFSFQTFLVSEKSVTKIFKKSKIWKPSKAPFCHYTFLTLFFFFFFSFFSFFFFIWVLQPFQEYFTYIKPIIHQNWAKATWPSVSRTWLPHMWPEWGWTTVVLFVLRFYGLVNPINHSGENLNGLRISSLIHKATWGLLTLETKCGISFSKVGAQT